MGWNRTREKDVQMSLEVKKFRRGKSRDGRLGELYGSDQRQTVYDGHVGHLNGGRNRRGCVEAMREYVGSGVESMV